MVGASGAPWSQMRFGTHSPERAAAASLPGWGWGQGAPAPQGRLPHLCSGKRGFLMWHAESVLPCKVPWAQPSPLCHTGHF